MKRIPHRENEIITGTETASDYLAMQKRMGRFYLKGFVRLLDGRGESGRFLEVGCGPGYQTSVVAAKFPGASITAVEPSADMIATARDYLAGSGAGERVSFLQGRAEDLPSLLDAGQRFDLIYTTFSLHHWNDPVRALRNLRERLNSGGTLLVYDFERRWAICFLPFVRKGIMESIRASYTAVELRKLCGEAGLGNVTVTRQFPYLYLRIEG